jgi:hypothetical protein
LNNSNGFVLNRKQERVRKKFITKARLISGALTTKPDTKLDGGFTEISYNFIYKLAELNRHSVIALYRHVPHMHKKHLVVQLTYLRFSTLAQNRIGVETP